MYARCPHHRSTTTNTAQPQRVGALLPMPSCLGIGGHPSLSQQGHPRYTGARTTGRTWVAHTNAQRAKRTCHDAYSRQSNTLVFRQTESRSAPTFVRPVPNELGFNTGASWKPMFLVGRLIGVCSPLTSMQNLGSKPVFGIGPARWPGSAQGSSLIPVSGVCEVSSVM